jgi:NAD(P)H-hydrate repair Nnr-like enzyme with NAD(P)H-hydrate epimerase domain
MKMIEVKTEAGNLFIDAIFGFSMSAIVSGIMPEAIHAVTTIVKSLFRN